MVDMNKSKISHATKSNSVPTHRNQQDFVGKEIGKEIGKVFHFFSNVNVAAIKLSGNLKIGDKIHIKGMTTDFGQKIDSMQIHNKVVKEAKKGDEIGVKVKDKVRPNDTVFLVK